MASLDYGALLKVNGNFINKNGDLFMGASDTGFIFNKAFNPSLNEEIHVHGNYYVYAGDENLLLCFYKTTFTIISNGVVVCNYSNYTNSFDKEEIYMDNLPVIKVERLSGVAREDISCMPETDGKERLIQRYGYSYGLLKWYREWKSYERNKRAHSNMSKTNRFKASWEYNGNKYEVIYGYGIDPSEMRWNKIKTDSYGFSEDEIELIDKWFE